MSQQNNNNQSVIPRRSRRLATIIPASDWISIGYSEDDAPLMERLQNDIKKYCDEENETTIVLNGSPSVILRHHDMMLPHWQKLAKALHGRTSINSIRIAAISMPVSVLDIMLPTFQSMNNLVDLRFCAARLGGYRKLLSFVKDNTSIQKFVLGMQELGNVTIANTLADAVNDHPSLEIIGLIQCGLNNATVLGIILEGCARLNSISIQDNNLGSESAAVIADFIRSNHQTEDLDFSRNNIKDNDIELIASALGENTHLKCLNLMDNDITEEGEKHILKALYDPTSMDSIVESNHICFPFVFDPSKTSEIVQRSRLEQNVFIINDDRNISIKEKIRQKVVLALCGVEGELFDLSYLNDLPLKVMPRVLELIQEHTTLRSMVLNGTRNTPQLERDTLSRLFHTLRGWELPLLFENLRPKKGPTTGKRKRKTRR